MTSQTASQETEPETGTTRRRILKKTATAAGTVVIAPQFVDVATGATSSGNVELTTTSTIPTDTGISVRIYEDTNGDGTAENQQEESLSGGTDEVTEYAALDGKEGQGIEYWLELTLTTSDDSVTPEMDTATITLPESTQTTEPPTQAPIEGPDDPQGAFELWDNYRAFVAAVVLAFGAIGMWGKSLATGAMLGYLAFAYIAVSTQTPLFIQILYVTIVLVFVGMAFKLWRAEFGGE